MYENNFEGILRKYCEKCSFTWTLTTWKFCIILNILIVLRSLRTGIVSAVMAIKHIALCYEEESNAWPEKSSEDFEESSLSEKAKKAVPYLR